MTTGENFLWLPVIRFNSFILHNLFILTKMKRNYQVKRMKTIGRCLTKIKFCLKRKFKVTKKETLAKMKFKLKNFQETRKSIWEQLFVTYKTPEFDNLARRLFQHNLKAKSIERDCFLLFKNYRKTTSIAYDIFQLLRLVMIFSQIFIYD